MEARNKKGAQKEEGEKETKKDKAKMDNDQSIGETARFKSGFKPFPKNSLAFELD